MFKQLSICIILLLFAVNSFAKSPLVGTWVNGYPRPMSVNKIIFSEANNVLTAEAWGQCQTKACPWGKATAIPFVRKQYNSPKNAKLFLAQFNSATEKHTLLIRTYSDSRLSVTSMTESLGNNAGNNYVSMDTLGWTPPPGVTLGAPMQLAVEPYSTSQYNTEERVRLRWQQVRGASNYTVEVDCQTCCKAGAWCSTDGRPWRIYPNIRSYRYTLKMPGTGTMRWRVWANDASGNRGSASAWVNLPATE